MKKVLCVGSANADVIIMPVDNIPPAGTLRSVNKIETHVGGCAANAAIDIAKIGVPVALCCKLGDDIYGHFVEKTASTFGVDTSHIAFDEAVETTVSTVLVNSSGERSFLYCPGSAAMFTSNDIPAQAANSCDIVFVAGALLLTAFDNLEAPAFLQKQQQAGKYTVMDTAWDFEDIWLPKILKSIPFLDLFMPSREEAEKLSGHTDVDEIIDFFKNLGAKNVIIKMGKDGARVCENDGTRYTAKTYNSIKPIDTTGAGDSFCAGFLCGLSHEWNFRDCVAFANAVGTHCIQSIGASTGIKPFNEIIDFMKKHSEELL